MARRNIVDRSIVITGASSGIGAATATACAAAGMHVVLNARREERLRDLAASIQRDHDRQAVVVAGDVNDETNTSAVLDAASGLPGGLYAVFANAGYSLDLSVAETDDAALRAIFETNFFAATHLIREAANRLLASGEPGHLIMCSSCLSKMGVARHGAYCATKAAQNYLCRSMRMELREHGIEVASVHPVTTRTELFSEAEKRSGDDSEFSTLPDRMPAMFVQTPQRVAQAVVKCLRKPRPEVWTSMTTRLSAGLLTAFPGVLDFVMRQRMAKRIMGK